MVRIKVKRKEQLSQNLEEIYMARGQRVRVRIESGVEARLHHPGPHRPQEDWGLPLCAGQVQSVTHCTRGRISLNHLNVKLLTAQLCQTLCNPMDCSQPGSSIHVIFRARVLVSTPIKSSSECLVCRSLPELTRTACLGDS